MYCYHPLLDGHDFPFHKMRFEALIKAIKEGQFVLYIDYDAITEYGYLAHVFYSDFLLIPFAIIGLFTDFMTAYQTMVFTITVLCGVFTYLFVNKVYKSSYAASVSGLVYTFCIYRLIDLYHRAALGETIAFTIIPIVMLGLYHIISGNYKKWYIFTIGFCLMIYAHTISSVMMFIFVLLLLLIYVKRLVNEPKRIFYLLLSGIATLPLIAYYLLPMVEQVMSDTFYFETNPVVYMFNTKYSLRDVMWGLTASPVTSITQPFITRIGILLTLLICLRLFVKKKNSYVKSADILLLMGSIAVFAVTPFFPWQYYPFTKLNFIQFPWRFYEFASFFFAVAGGFYASQIAVSNKRLTILGIMIVACIITTLTTDRKNYQYMHSLRSINPKGTVDNHFHIGMGKEYLPNKVPTPWYTDKGGNKFPSLIYIAERSQKIETGNEETIITDLSKKKGVTRFYIETAVPDKLELPLIYYKGYKATLNGQEVILSESDNGLVTLDINASGRVEVWYAGTNVQHISWYLTLVSIASLCIFIFASNRKEKKNAGIDK